MTDRQKQSIISRIDSARDLLIGLSHQIHANPELAFEEFKASTWCADALEAEGFAVERGICDLPTAFRATIGSGALVIGICCEYDALPEIGHACGHNIIAAAAVGTGIAIAELVDELDITLVVLGTPAEEGGGGKILMLERGGFDRLNASMMVHPWTSEMAGMPCLAVTHFDVHYLGVEAHASAYPERGRNAADAITIAQVSIGLLRQHANPGDQIHGIVTNGGAAPNIVPAHTTAKYYARSFTLEKLDEWLPRVHRCFEAGAIATETSVEYVTHSPPYSEFLMDEPMAKIYRENAEALGRAFAPPAERFVAASTDMGNVSLVIPAIHPTLDIEALPAVNHQASFAAHCVSKKADRALLDGAMAMAMTVIDLSTGPARTRLLERSYQHHSPE
ncbi:MAG TPA: M20 family metallopeptidase [Acidimicrobiales bacterium]|nr:M20 family metallopeptidase [Acidimicrobiales bacterium]